MATTTWNNHSRTLSLWLTAAILHLLCGQILCKLDHSLVGNPSYFSFINTEKTSNIYLRDTCFDVDNSSLNTMYTGISLFLKNTRSLCKSEYMDLTEIRKFIIYDKHQRPLCRTKVTVSIDSGHCDKTLEEFKYMCENLKDKQNFKVYFQECTEDRTYRDTEHNTKETEVIILSSFPKPVMGKFGYIYNIPRVHCDIKECQIDDCLTNGSKETKTSFNRVSRSFLVKGDRRQQCRIMSNISKYINYTSHDSDPPEIFHSFKERRNCAS